MNEKIVRDKLTHYANQAYKKRAKSTNPNSSLN